MNPTDSGYQEWLRRMMSSTLGPKWKDIGYTTDSTFKYDRESPPVKTPGQVEKELIDKMRDAFPSRTARMSDHSDHLHFAVDFSKTGTHVHTAIYDEAWGFAADKKENSMNRTEVIAAELARLQDELAQRNVYGEDDYAEGTVLRFKANYGGEKSYTYAAIKAGGKWHLTGSQSNSNMTWSQLVDTFLRTNATKVRVMVKGDRIV